LSFSRGLFAAALTTEVQLYGIARLRYRPHTAMTAAWWAELTEKGVRLIELFTNLGAPSAGFRAA